MPPSMGRAPRHPSPPTEPPRPLSLAVGLMYVGAVLSVVGTFIGLADMGEAKRRIAENNPSLSSAEVDSMASGAAGVTVLVSLLVAGVWVWMAIMNRKGRSWARVIGTILGVIAGVFTSISLAVSVGTSGDATADMMVSVVNLVLAVVIVILLFRPESNAYYEAMSRPNPIYGYGDPPPRSVPPRRYHPY